MSASLSDSTIGGKKPDRVIAQAELIRFLTETRFRFIRGYRQLRTPEDTCSEHDHEFIELVYHVSGRGATRVRGVGRPPAETRTVFVYLPGVGHDQTFVTPMLDWRIHLSTAGPLPPSLPPYWRLLNLSDPLVVSELQFLVSAVEPYSFLERASLDCRAGAILSSVIASR